MQKYLDISDIQKFDHPTHEKNQGSSTNERKNHKFFNNLPQQEAGTKEKQIIFWL